MSLTIYDLKDKEKVGKIIRENDIFFNGRTILTNEPLSNEILKEIDRAAYNTSSTFIGRDIEIGALNKSCLSTGTKTLLNIISYPDKCFDVIECGHNALSVLPKIHNGMIYWERPVLMYNGPKECDIIYKGKHYTDIFDFLEVTMKH